MTFQKIIECCLNFDNDLEHAYDYLRKLYKIAKPTNYENARKT